VQLTRLRAGEGGEGREAHGRSVGRGGSC
jgi:hypothetical protein